ncbi:MAG: hypothetical protein ABR591_06235 [Candidatus Velthaea sp.]
MMQAVMGAGKRLEFTDQGAAYGRLALREFAHVRASTLGLSTAQPKPLDSKSPHVKTMERRWAGAKLASAETSDRFTRELREMMPRGRSAR